MELDTGAAVSLISETTWSDHLHNPSLEPSGLQLQSYPDRKLGCRTVDVKIQNAETELGRNCQFQNLQS